MRKSGLLLSLTLAEWRAHPLRCLVSIIAIALGVALGFAVQLINTSAYGEFSAAMRTIAGQSDLQIRGRQGFLPEDCYERIASYPDVAACNPLIELHIHVQGSNQSLQVIGIDPLRIASISPDLLPIPEHGGPLTLLDEHSIFLSRAALEHLKLQVGEDLTLDFGGSPRRLHIAGLVPRARPGQVLAVMDIGALQWYAQWLGQISRLDVVLKRGIDPQRFRNELEKTHGAAIVVAQAQDEESRSANLSRAYRVNLNVLALVALLTGAFLVLSSQSLSVIRRRQQFAFMRVVGYSRQELLTQLLAEGGLVGVLGSSIGIIAGYSIAATVLTLFGGDLGGRYFASVRPSVSFDVSAACIFAALGVLVALAGSWIPALDAADTPPAHALKPGAEELAFKRLHRPWLSLTICAIGGLLSLLPPMLDLPVFGYLAVGLLLLGGIGLMPAVAHIVFARLARWTPRNSVFILAFERLNNAAGQATIALGGVLCSVSLMVAMGIMVSSFRLSVEQWLAQVLHADLYVRVAQGNDADALTHQDQDFLRHLPGVTQVDFQRTTWLTLDTRRPAVAILAKPIELEHPERSLPLLDDLTVKLPLAANRYPIWVSEAMLDLYHWSPGETVELPLGGVLHACQIMGVWRDYVRQSGAIQMRLEDYRMLSNDQRITDAALWIETTHPTEQVIAALHASALDARIDIAQPGELRRISLTIFDRSFAITYLLEAVAIVIGMFGVAATFSAQTLARAREFGMMRHVGVTRAQILAQLGLEGGSVTMIGILVGFLLGFCISLILIYVINPQSFHWSMNLHVPWAMLITVACALVLAAVLTALLAGRQAISGSAIRAVREDW